ncbi:pentapeptide repeat-containing protein [Shewanella submarina]|uniref:Pentapeptide repeat-containing protein n=1 Tax=Shewanella submarina TaxID=2016376 RepID=A0ABV7GJD4_9GAMM|nr:pentapeptide repeat-containing protein [Shewanella submarina]MCL1035975.1 pentapeptide repeat-containing protein [Shewanella submarina]
MDTKHTRCSYHEQGGHKCHETAGKSGLCYWHDPNITKNHPEDKERLEEYAKNGGQLRGISLRRADLEGIDLVNHHHKQGYDMAHADFYRANLSGAHLFHLKLNDANLMKADLRDANLHMADVDNANLLGVKWNGAKIENINVGRSLMQERLADKALEVNENDIALDYYEQAEEIYRDLRKAAEREGLFGMSGNYIRHELTMRRYQMPRISTERSVSKLIDLFCGYGEAPLRVVGFSMVLILICAVCYFFTGLSYGGEELVFSPTESISEQFSLFFNCLYYSVVTFTTLGYGDFTPIGYSRAVAAFEAFTGSFTIALFVVVFVKKMTR